MILLFWNQPNRDLTDSLVPSRMLLKMSSHCLSENRANSNKSSPKCQRLGDRSFSSSLCLLLGYQQQQTKPEFEASRDRWVEHYRCLEQRTMIWRITWQWRDRCVVELAVMLLSVWTVHETGTTVCSRYHLRFFIFYLYEWHNVRYKRIGA